MARTLHVEIVGDSKDFEKAMGRVAKTTEDFGSRLKGMAKTAGIAGGAAALGAVVVGLKSSLSAAKDAEAAQVRLKDALGAANVSFGQHGAAIQASIEKTSKLAALDDEDLSDAFAKLVRSTGDVTKATEGMALAADIARARGISLESATKTVEKGLLGQEAAFRRVGVEIGKNTTATEAFEKAQAQFAGAAEAHGKTAAGAQERLSVAFENLQEKIGQKLVPMFARLMEWMLKAVEWTERNWPKFEAVFARSVEIVRNVIDKIRPILDGVIEYFRGVIKIIEGIFKGEWGQVWEGIKQAAVGALKAIFELDKLWLETAAKVWKKMGEMLKEAFFAGLKGLKEGAIALLKLAANAYIGLWNLLIDKINTAIAFEIPSMDPLGKFGPTIPGFKFDPPDIPKIPTLAMGGIVTRPTLAMIGEAGPEAVVPLSRGGGGVGTTVHVHVAGSVIAERELLSIVQNQAARYTRGNDRLAFGK